MGYAHGCKWTENLINKELSLIISKFNLKKFPSVKQMDILTGKKGLSNAICRHGGTKYWAEKMNLDLKRCETFFGEEYEEECFKQLLSMGYVVEHMSTRFPYDLTANKHIKIDVKVGRLYTNAKIGSFYSFNLEKKIPTCDVFVCYCVNKEYEIDKVYVIPSKIMYGKTQLSVGQKESMYDKYKDNWEILKIYDDFYTSI